MSNSASIWRILISTHAPRTGSDMLCSTQSKFSSYFNPRSPHGERPDLLATSVESLAIFQPTLPARGATLRRCRERNLSQISTHAPRTGSDGGTVSTSQKERIFQPTLPARGATSTAVDDGVTMHISTHAPRTGSDDNQRRAARWRKYISTHAPRTGSDTATASIPPNRRYFNPRSPHGERQAPFATSISCR